MATYPAHTAGPAIVSTLKQGTTNMIERKLRGEREDRDEIIAMAHNRRYDHIQGLKDALKLMNGQTFAGARDAIANRIKQLEGDSE